MIGRTNAITPSRRSSVIVIKRLKNTDIVTVIKDGKSYDVIQSEDLFLTIVDGSGNVIVTATNGEKTVEQIVTIDTVGIYTINLVVFPYVEDGLIACLDAIDNTENGHTEGSLSTWFDTSLNGNNLTFSSIVAPSSNYIQMNGIYGSFNADSLSGKIRTIEMYFEQLSKKTIYDNLFSFGGDSGCHVWHENGKYILRYCGRINQKSLSIPVNSFPTGKVHLAIVHNTNGSVDIYFNGLLDTRANWNISFPPNFTNALLNTGGDSDGDKNYTTNVKWYSFRIYDRALSEEEIFNNFNVDKKRFI